MVKKKVMAVRSRVARMKHQQWRIKSNMDKDINRAEAITGETKQMISNNINIGRAERKRAATRGQSINDIHKLDI